MPGLHHSSILFSFLSLPLHLPSWKELASPSGKTSSTHFLMVPQVLLHHLPNTAWREPLVPIPASPVKKGIGMGKGANESGESPLL